MTQRATRDGGTQRMTQPLKKTLCRCTYECKITGKSRTVLSENQNGRKAIMSVILNPYECEHSCEMQPPIDTMQRHSTAVFASELPRCKRFHFIKK